MRGARPKPPCLACQRECLGGRPTLKPLPGRSLGLQLGSDAPGVALGWACQLVSKCSD
jgi:hypothetical protein